MWSRGRVRVLRSVPHLTAASGKQDGRINGRMMHPGRVQPSTRASLLDPGMLPGVTGDTLPHSSSRGGEDDQLRLLPTSRVGRGKRLNEAGLDISRRGQRWSVEYSRWLRN